MTVAELIKQLEKMPQNVEVCAEGEHADRVAYETCPDGHGIVRIFKSWGVKFVGRGIANKGDEGE